MPELQMPMPDDVDPAFVYAARLAAIDAAAAEDALSLNTRAAYRRCWDAFEDWCIDQRACPMPATAATVRAFVAALRDRDQPASVSTLNQHLSAIWARHVEEGRESPRGNEDLKVRMQGYARQDHDRRIRQMSALLMDDLERIYSAMDRDLADGLARTDDPRGQRKLQLVHLRDRAVLGVGMSTALRREELAGLDLEDCQEGPKGIVITPRKTKKDQTGQDRKPRPVPRGTRIELCPVTSLHAWLAAAEITDGPLFRPVDQWGTVRPRAFTGQVVTSIVKTRATAAGLPGTWGAHSLRAGFATQSAMNGVPRHVIKADGDWDSDAVDVYVRRGAIWDQPAAAQLGF